MNKILTILLVVVVAVFGFVLLENKKDVPAVVITNDKQNVPELVDGRQCYTYSHEKTDSEPYTTSEFIDMTISGNTISGTKTGTQSGPDMTNGYTGTIVGTLKDGVITDTFSYVIEGSSQKEAEIYHAGVTGIDKWRYSLKEEGGVLVPDLSTDYKVLHYARVGCEGSN